MTTPPQPVTIRRAGVDWELVCTQHVPYPLDDVFNFFASVRNLERITPDFLHFRIRRAPADPLRAGALIDYRLGLHGVPVWWRTKIQEWQPPRRFVDVQLRGPFRLWHHTHEFIADDTGTLITDTVRFDVYFRLLYRTPIMGWIDRDLRRIFEYRRARIGEVLRQDLLSPAKST